jgi:predicted nucleic acid-binding protein
MLLADTGPLVAVANARDQHHQACRDLLETHPGPVLVPAPVIVEVCQLLAARRGTHAEAAFLASLGAAELEVVDLEPADYTRAAQLVQQYASLPLGAVDATVLAVAERLTTTEIATLDRRHFTIVRPTHTHAFTLLPESLL